MRILQKKYWILSLFTVFVCFISISFIYSYFTDKDTVKNNFSVGENIIEIDEEFVPPEDIKPGDTIKKEVVVQNTGSVECYVRVFAEPNDSRILQYITVDFNTEDWTTKQEDGYYYYKKSIKPEEKTTPLFTKVVFSKDADKNMINKFDLIVFAESVQSESYNSYTDAFNDIKSK